MADANDYGSAEERADDYAAMLADVEQRADPRTLRLALGADDDELERIRIGHAPSEKTANRLRLLQELSRKADLSDPRAVVAALARGGEGTRLRPTTAALAVFGTARRAKLAIVAFVVADILVALAIVAIVALRAS